MDVIQVSFNGAKIAKFSTKPGKMGETIGQLTIEMDSDSPFVDFAPLHHFKAGQFVNVVLEAVPGDGRGE